MRRRQGCLSTLQRPQECKERRAEIENCLSPECCLRTAEAAPIGEKAQADHQVRHRVLSPMTEKRFNSRAAPTEISTYRRGFPLAGGTGARCSSIPSVIGRQLGI